MRDVREVTPERLRHVLCTIEHSSPNEIDDLLSAIEAMQAKLTECDRLREEVLDCRTKLFELGLIGGEITAERDRLLEENEWLRKHHQQVQSLVDAQAKDEGLWFQAQTAPEGYLQAQLRRLHAVIEAELP
jgi:hypothetical protein